MPQDAQTTSLDGPMEAVAVDATVQVKVIGIDTAMDHVLETVTQIGMEVEAVIGAAEELTGKCCLSLKVKFRLTKTVGVGMIMVTMLDGWTTLSLRSYMHQLDSTTIMHRIITSPFTPQSTFRSLHGTNQLTIRLSPLKPQLSI